MNNGTTLNGFGGLLSHTGRSGFSARRREYNNNIIINGTTIPPLR